MKVAVITRHAVINYGSLLQAYATQQVIHKLGYECEIIDYIREDETYQNREKTLLKRKERFNKNALTRTAYLALREPESLIAGKKFDSEQKHYLHLTKRYGSLLQLQEDKPQADIYLTGSDQVWGPVENGSYDSAYCLSFTDEKDRRLAYAASFGHAELEIEQKEYFKKWLSRYESICVREDSAISILKEINISAKQVLDPTLLLDSHYWEKLTKPNEHGEYILVYQLHKNTVLDDYAERVAKEQHLKLIRISSSLHQITRPGKFVFCPSISEFLTYIRNAKCLITDSFHGTAFAINFNTPFVEILPNNNTGTRNISILNLTGLTDRVMKNANDTALAAEKIDFSYANDAVSKERRRSIDILKTMLETTSEEK